MTKRVLHFHWTDFIISFLAAQTSQINASLSFISQCLKSRKSQTTGFAAVKVPVNNKVNLFTSFPLTRSGLQLGSLYCQEDDSLTINAILSLSTVFTFHVKSDL